MLGSVISMQAWLRLSPYAFVVLNILARGFGAEAYHDDGRKAQDEAGDEFVNLEDFGGEARELLFSKLEQRWRGIVVVEASQVAVGVGHFVDVILVERVFWLHN